MVIPVNNFWEKQKIGEHINTDNLREIRNICLDIVDMTFEISEAQAKQTESIND